MSDKERKQEFPPLEMKCGSCGGYGHEYGQGCAQCQGTGRELTKFGEAVVAMLERQGFVRKEG